MFAVRAAEAEVVEFRGTLMALETQIHPAALLQASTVAEQFAADVQRQTSGVEPETTAGARALTGFRMSQVLEAVHSGWADAMARHRRYLDQIGAALASTGHDYRGSDAEVSGFFSGLDRF